MTDIKNKGKFQSDKIYEILNEKLANKKLYKKRDIPMELLSKSMSDVVVA